MRRLTLALSFGFFALYACGDEEGEPGGTAGTSGSGKGGTAGAGTGGKAGSAGRGGASGSSGTSGKGGASGASGSSGNGGRGGAGTSGNGGSSGEAGESAAGGQSGQGGSSGGSSGDGGRSDGGDAGDPGVGGTSGRGGTTANGGEGGQVDPGPNVITPNEGGRLEIDGAVLLAGPNAVAASITLTGSSSSSTTGLPHAADLRGLVYTLGPEGFVFEEPVLLSLPVTGAAPFGKQWVVVWLDEASNQWIPIPTIITGGRALAAVRHFTLYTIMEWNRVVAGVGCELPAPCGGVLSGGEHQLNETCYTGAAPPSGPLSFCEGSTGYSQEIMLSSGTLSFGIETDDVFRATTVAAFRRLTLQPACIATVGSMTDSTVSACSELGGPLGAVMGLAVVCSGNIVQSCSCHAPTTQMVESIATGTYATQGNTLTITTTQGTSTLDYCVDGSNLYATDTGDFDWVYVQ